LFVNQYDKLMHRLCKAQKRQAVGFLQYLHQKAHQQCSWYFNRRQT